ncbi:MAG TPA: ABC transporter permease [Puia sp.]|jgi:putative ABC transport system permease protein|nr:ABC transporter permease [Puia sp.]
MLTNYFKVALRSLIRHKGYTIINILGLAVGITCCMLIMIFVRSEFSYDKFHSKAGNIYRVWQREKADGKEFLNTVTPLPAGPALQSTFPEVVSACRVYSFNTLVKVSNNSFNENINMVDPSFFSMFSFNLTRGNKANAFPSANTIILTPEMARKYFGNDNAVGKNMELQLGDDKVMFMIAGIAKKSEEESSIKYDFLIPYDNAKYLFKPRMFHNWFNIFTETYVLLKDNANVAALEKKFPSMMKQQLGENYGKEEYDLYLQPITDIHLNIALPTGNLPTSDPKYSYILASIGILILLVACINFITLSVGRSTSRAMEVGVRKTLGAQRQQLMRQFWGEAFLMTVISFIIGLLSSSILMGAFNQLIERNLSLHFDWMLLLFCIGLIAMIALIAGIYPAVILSGFNPVEVLKGKLKMNSSSTGLLRKGLIVGQFACSIAMIICTIVISEQMQYLQHRNLGYNKQQVVVVPTNKKRADGFALAKLYKNELIKHPEVISVTAAVFSFAETPWATLGFSDEKKAYHSFQYNEVDPYFLQAMQIKMQEGHWFDASNTAEVNSSIVVNEALVKEYGLSNPIGKKFGKYTQQIIGVMKNFNYESLHTPVKPLMLSLNADTIFRLSEDVSFQNSPQPRVSVRLKQGNIADNIKILESSWKLIAPNQDFEYHFLDASLAASYKQEQKSSTIVKLASALSVFIACMGLFGLATLTVARRTKEIGIRKVMGATVMQVVQLLSKDFIVLVAIAALVSFPLAWWAMNRWLADFAYKVDIGWWVFAVAGCSVIFIALLTISYNAIKAGMANPVKSLRTE